KKNPEGLGAEVTIYCDKNIQRVEQYPSRGYISSVDPVLHFGLGSRKNVDSIQVVWPDGKEQVLRNVPADKPMDFSYAEAEFRTERTIPQISTILEDRSESTEQIVHKEDPYIDFQDHPLLLKML